jgi:hypothetical protein
MQFVLIKKNLKTSFLKRAKYLPAGMEARWTKVAEKYCWAHGQWDDLL